MDVLSSRRFTQRAGVSLPSVERPHIYKNPPQALFLRKKERVSEADVNWMIRPDGAGSDPSRINEGIRYYARGINPSVEVSYSNVGPGSTTTSLKTAQPGSIYKLDVVRPPLFPVETTHSLSRPRTHQNVTVETNPGLPVGVASNTLANDVDQLDLLNALRLEKSSGPIPATAYYKIEQPMPMSAKWAINENMPLFEPLVSNPGLPVNLDSLVCREESPYGTIIRPKISAVSNPSLTGFDDRNDDASAHARKEILLRNIDPNFQLVVYDPSNHVASEVTANIRDKENIAVNAALGIPISLALENGQIIKLKDYNWTAVNTNVGLDQVILTVENPDIHLERNTPLFAVNTNVSLHEHYGSENVRNLQDNIYLDKKVYNHAFDNQSSFIPQMGRTLASPKIVAKNQMYNDRLKQASSEAFQRLFE